MSSLLEQSLDEIIQSSPSSRRGAPRRPRGSSNRNSKRVNSRPNSRNSRSSHRDDHDRGSHRSRVNPLLHLPADQQRQEPYLRVSNLHPELTEAELSKLFSGIGPLSFVNLQFNTRGESTGIAFVGYEHPNDFRLAIEKFDGRRAAGQIISVENAVPLADRIGFNGGSRGNGRGRAKGPRGRARGGPQSRPRLVKKSVEELDAELNNYMGGQSQGTESTNDDGQPPHAQEQQEQQQSGGIENSQQQLDGQQAPFPAQDNGEMAMD